MADEFILETHGLTKEFAGFFAVRDVALKVRRGSIHALIGPNGAGKTTCFNLLTKFLSPSAGKIVYKGQDITAMAPADVARLGLVRSFQISAVFPHLNALENFSMNRRIGNRPQRQVSLVWLSAYAQLSALPNPCRLRHIPFRRRQPGMISKASRRPAGSR